MLKEDKIKDKQAIEPIKINIGKDSVKLTEYLLEWKPIYTKIVVIAVLICAAYILFKIAN